MVKVEAKEYKEFRDVLIKCIQLLSLCRNITDMDETFKHVVRLFLSPKQKSANSSIIVLTNRVRKNSEALKEIKLEDDIEEDDIEEDDMILFKEEKKDGIYRNTPFFKRYNNIYEQVKSEIKRELDNNNDQLEETDNKFYAPELAEHLVIRWMRFVKLWSALGLDLLDPEISQDSNNYAEAQFRVTKTLTFKGIANSSLADRIRELELERT